MGNNDSYAELLVRISRPTGTGAYQVEISFDRADQPTIPQPVFGLAEFDFSDLPDPHLESEEYGSKLRDLVFATPELTSHYAVCLATVEQDGLELCVRLAIDNNASELHNLKWETLRRPSAGSAASLPLAADQNVPFSRFLYSSDWSSIDLRPKGELRALVVVSNPAELSANPAGYLLNTHKELRDNLPVFVTRSLAPVDIEAELQRIVPALSNLARLEIMESRKEGPDRPSIENLRRKLNEGWDVLYLVCHGVLLAADITKLNSRRKPVLVLEDEAGSLKRVDGEELASAIRGLPFDKRPRLAVLVSCQSAGSDATPTSSDKGALSAIGPQLVAAGIPAVIAMQGDARMDSMEKFIPRLFAELHEDGRIDRAVSAARQELAGQDDWWVPVLYQRLKSGRVWYIPGFGDNSGDFEKWRSLKTFVQRKMCTPIIGPALAEPWLGLQSDIALKWARDNGYPFDRDDRDNLPQIAQFLLRRDGPKFLPLTYLEALQARMIEKFGQYLSADLKDLPSWSETDLIAALEAISEKHWEKYPAEPHILLAKLKLPIYITTSPSSLLELAIKKVSGREPHSRICPWWMNNIPEELWSFDKKPTSDEPLVYHLFGRLDYPDSLVLSEDNYFDFLIGVTRNKDLIPASIRDAITRTALLFQGFRTEEWSFRVLFRTLMAQEGSHQLRGFSHVAAQLEPEEDRLIDSQRARKHLETYFESERISIFWGRPEEFLSALAQHIPDIKK